MDKTDVLRLCICSELRCNRERNQNIRARIYGLYSSISVVFIFPQFFIRILTACSG